MQLIKNSVDFCIWMCEKVQMISNHLFSLAVERTMGQGAVQCSSVIRKTDLLGLKLGILYFQLNTAQDAG